VTTGRRIEPLHGAREVRDQHATLAVEADAVRLAADGADALLARAVGRNPGARPAAVGGPDGAVTGAHDSLAARKVGADPSEIAERNPHDGPFYEAASRASNGA
jgi:hypothetical protein